MFLLISDNIFNNSSDYINQISAYDKITLFIAIIGCLLSLYNFIKDIAMNRSRLSISFKKATLLKPYNGNPIVFRMMIENCSRLPISISRMFLSCEDAFIEFEWVPENIFHAETLQSGKIINSNTYSSVSFPINIPGLGAAGGFFNLYTYDTNIHTKFYNRHLELILHTNRGKKRFALQIDDSNFTILN